MFRRREGDCFVCDIGDVDLRWRGRQWLRGRHTNIAGLSLEDDAGVDVSLCRRGLQDDLMFARLWVWHKLHLGWGSVGMGGDCVLGRFEAEGL